MVHRVQVRKVSTDQGNKLLGIVRRASGSVVTWRRAQMVLLSAQGMDVPMIVKVTFTSPDRVRDLLQNVNADGFGSLKPRCARGRPPEFTLSQRQEIEKTALARPADHGLPFSVWSLSKLADFLTTRTSSNGGVLLWAPAATAAQTTGRSWCSRGLTAASHSPLCP